MQHVYRSCARKGAHFTRLALLSATVALTLSTIASAQVLDPLRGYALDGSPVGGAPRAARGQDAPYREASPRRRAPVYASAARIKQLAEAKGYKLTTAPERHGRILTASAQTPDGHRFDLIINPRSGIIIGTKDLGTTAVATSAPDDKAPTADVAPAAPSAATETQTAVADSSSSPDDAVAAAKAAVAKAADAAAEAKKIADARAEESRAALVKLQQAQVEARKVAQAKALETRRQQALAAAQLRNEARLNEAKKRAVAAAEAKLAQAKAQQDKIAADVKRAEMDAATARAAVEPAEMTKTADKPAELAPAAAPDAATSPESKSTSASVEPAAAEPAAKAEETKSETAGAESTDTTPTGSTTQSPPYPYSAPTPDEAAAQSAH